MPAIVFRFGEHERGGRKKEGGGEGIVFGLFFTIGFWPVLRMLASLCLVSRRLCESIMTFRKLNSRRIVENQDLHNLAV